MKKESIKPNLVQNELDMMKFWEDNKVFEKLKEENKKTGKYFATMDGPITANGMTMGLHHAFGRSLKDAMIKYRAITGHDMHYQNGFDAQGLWVEVNAEKDLGLNSKKDIEKFGIDKFTEYCMEKVRKCSSKMTEQSIRLGQWMNWDDSYYTNSDENITTIWHFLKTCHEKGWLIEKYRPMPWCTRCGTSLSEHEMADGDAYRNDTCKAVFIKLPVKGEDFRILVWTTTPWTLSSNVAVAVNPELEYSICKVKSDDKLICVCSTATKVLKDDIVSVERTVMGSELVGLEYETCFEELPLQNFTHKIVAWDQVDATEGAGSVHIAPGCGAEDFELGQSLGLPNVCPIDDGGIFYDNFGFLSGLDANKDEIRDLIFDELKKRNKLYYFHDYTHRYPHCWRCKSPILFRLIKEWAISMDEIRPMLIEEAKKVEWQPAFYEKRMIDWLTNMGDWSISRKRYYGLPLPIYVCPDCGEKVVLGSKEELKEMAVQPELVDKLPHLHRPYIDEVKIKCPKCGSHIERIKDVGDCWLDAGIAPFSTNKYFSDRKFWEENYPAECVIEMKEQIRLWFYSMLVMGVALTGKSPYKKVSTYGSLLAQDGKKLSKSSPNNIPLNEAFDNIGADIIRYTFCSTNPQSDVIFSYDSTDEVRRRLLSLWNVFVFFNTYAIIDNPKLDGYLPKEEDLTITDKWLIARTNEFATKSQEYYEQVKTCEVVSEFERYIDDLSNWYIRVNRRRFWKNEEDGDKLNAYFCLEYAIKNTAMVMAPIMPFMMEYIWQNQVREVEPNETLSVMLSKFKIATYKITDTSLLEQTDIVRSIIASALKLRNENNLKVKQPLKKAFVINEDKNTLNAIENYKSLIEDELNIKEIELSTDVETFNDHYLTLNFRNAGRVLKGDVQKMKEALDKTSDEVMQSYVESFDNGKVKVEGFEEFDSELFVKNSKPKKEFILESENGMTVVLDTTLTQELVNEGILREIIRNAQVLRKEANFEIDDRIEINITSDDENITNILTSNSEKIKTEVLAVSFNEKSFTPDISKDIEVDDKIVKYELKKN
ncbi:MAG: isoleucine--tRNA ligase [Clostridiales bacterium]|nr:isoleucine--tRNA ligase [Clostridiales bacterium]